MQTLYSSFIMRPAANSTILAFFLFSASDMNLIQIRFAVIHRPKDLFYRTKKIKLLIYFIKYENNKPGFFMETLFWQT